MIRSVTYGRGEFNKIVKKKGVSLSFKCIGKRDELLTECVLTSQSS